MDALEQARAEIDAVDAQLAALFERRMAAVLQVAEYKRAHGLPVYDAARETAVLEKAAARIQDPALRPYYKDHVQNLMDVAKQYEAVVLGQNRAAYQGVEGAFAHIALRALFPHAEAVSYPTWDEVFDAVERGDAARGVVPFENSHAGDVSAVLDLCYNHPALWVVDVYDLPISQNLLVLPGTKLDQIKSVYSHQQAIAHCKRGDGGTVRAGGAGAQHQHRRRQHHPLYRAQPRKAYRRQPVLAAVHGGQQTRQAGRGDPDHRCQRLQYGVHQEPAHASCAV